MEENSKKCSDCGNYKLLTEFKLRKDTGKYKNICLECESFYFKNRYDNNRDEIREKARIKNTENPEPNRKRVKKWRKENPEKVKINRLKENERNRTTERRVILAISAANWRAKNPDKVKEIKKKQRNIIEVKIADNLRGRLRKAILNGQKAGSAVRDLGCSIEELKQRFETQFFINPRTDEQMSWENYGFYGWHIDHIIPLASFDLTDIDQFKKACHYTNLQPLWAEENLRKSDKIIK